MKTSSLNDENDKIFVRWPFRILAGFFVLFCVAGLVGTAVAIWLHGPGLLKWQFLVNLPGIAWFARLAWYAAIRGAPSAPAYWPFRSQRMFNWYMVFFAVALFY
jgi:hypothetical protein